MITFDALKTAIRAVLAKIPEKLPNPHSLRINGTEYDGSVPVDVEVAADVPDALPNPHALTINGTSYDGSAAVDVETEVATDTTLSVEGQAADAKAVGDALSGKADASAIPTDDHINNLINTALGVIENGTY